MRYSRVWRNKWLHFGVKNIDDMISRLQDAVAELTEMKAAGIQLDEQKSDGLSDFGYLITRDPQVAETFDFDEEKADFVEVKKPVVKKKGKTKKVTRKAIKK